MEKAVLVPKPLKFSEFLPIVGQCETYCLLLVCNVFNRLTQGVSTYIVGLLDNTKFCKGTSSGNRFHSHCWTLSRRPSENYRTCCSIHNAITYTAEDSDSLQGVAALQLDGAFNPGSWNHGIAPDPGRLLPEQRYQGTPDAIPFPSHPGAGGWSHLGGREFVHLRTVNPGKAPTIALGYSKQIERVLRAAISP